MLLLLTTAAHAFCGTFVGAPGTALTNHSSQVVIGRENGITTLTLAADFSGDAADFAMVLPIPEVIGPENVTEADPSLLQWIEAWSQPRAVAYTCDTLFDATQGAPGCGYMMGCASAEYSGELLDPNGDDAADSVSVEASFSAAGYDIVVLSAEESSDLFGWLDANGYALPEGGDIILQEYIDAGVYFLAAKVSLDAGTESGSFLPPLRIQYESDSFGLPIRIGTISASGEQEVVIFTVTPIGSGDVRISNYPEAVLDRECMWQPEEEGESMATWFGREIDRAVADAGGAAWVMEYSQELQATTATGYHCDPCTAEAVIPGGTFAPFGVNNIEAHLSRLRVRYTPETATEDLMLYEAGTLEPMQLRYLNYQEELEFAYPVCNQGFVENPGECPDDFVSGCTSPAPVGVAGLIGALALLRRRRA